MSQLWHDYKYYKVYLKTLISYNCRHWCPGIGRYWWSLKYTDLAGLCTVTGLLCGTWARDNSCPVSSTSRLLFYKDLSNLGIFIVPFILRLIIITPRSLCLRPLNLFNCHVFILVWLILGKLENINKSLLITVCTFHPINNISLGCSDSSYGCYGCYGGYYNPLHSSPLSITRITSFGILLTEINNLLRF